MRFTNSPMLSPKKFLLEPEALQLRRNLDALPANRPFRERDRVMFLIALETGARASEILLLQSSDFFSDSKSVEIKGLKGSNKRVLPLSETTFQAALNLNAEGALFPIKLRRMDQIWREVRPSNKSMHSMRHRVGAELYRQTRDLQLVQRVLGHKNINNTVIYTGIDMEDEMNKALVKLRGDAQ